MDKTENPFSRIIATADSQQELVNGISRELLAIVESFGFRKQCFAMQIADSAPTPFMLFWEHAFTCVVRQCMMLHMLRHLDNPRLPSESLPDDAAERAAMAAVRGQILDEFRADIDNVETLAVDGFHLLVCRCLEFTRMALAAPATEHNKNIFMLSDQCFEQVTDNRERLLAFYDNLESFCFNPTSQRMRFLLFNVSQSLLDMDRFTESVSLLMSSLSPSMPFYAQGMESVADWLTGGAQLVVDEQAVAAIPVAPSVSEGAELPSTAAVGCRLSAVEELPSALDEQVSSASVSAPSTAVAEGARGVAPRLLEADAERCWRALVNNHYCIREADRYRWMASVREYGFMVELVSKRLGFYSPDNSRHLLWREFSALFALDANVNSAQTQLGRYHKGKPSDKAVQEMRKLKGLL